MATKKGDKARQGESTCPLGKADTPSNKGKQEELKGESRGEGRQMKGDKAQTRPARRTPPPRETNEGRQGTDKTREADTTTPGRHMKGDK